MIYTKDMEARVAASRSKRNFVELSDVKSGHFYWWLSLREDPAYQDGYKHCLIPGIAVVVNGNIAICSSFKDDSEPWFILPKDGIYGATSVGPYPSKISVARMWEHAGRDDMAYRLWCEAQDQESPEQRHQRLLSRARLQLGNEWKPRIVRDQLEEVFDDLGITREDTQEEIPRSMYDRLLAKVGLQRIPK